MDFLSNVRPTYVEINLDNLAHNFREIERIVEKDMTADRSQTEEQDSAGGTRTVSSSNTGYQTVYQDGSQGTPFVAKTITPQVEGVLVVAEGAGKGNMTSEITQIAQALFGVEAHKVKVLEK